MGMRVGAKSSIFEWFLLIAFNSLIQHLKKNKKCGPPLKMVDANQEPLDAKSKRSLGLNHFHNFRENRNYTANFLHVHPTCNACVPLCTCSMHVNGTFIACNNLCMYLRLLCLSCMLGKHANACLANRNLKVGWTFIDSYLNREKLSFVSWSQALHVSQIKVTLTF